jgi:hypothetical protein
MAITGATVRVLLSPIQTHTPALSGNKNPRGIQFHSAPYSSLRSKLSISLGHL